MFRAVQDHAINAARAHTETVILEAFCRGSEACEGEGAKSALSMVCDLYALHNLEEDRGFFQEHGRLAAPRCKAITREVNRLCKRGASAGGRTRRCVWDSW